MASYENTINMESLSTKFVRRIIGYLPPQLLGVDEVQNQKRQLVDRYENSTGDSVLEHLVDQRVCAFDPRVHPFERPG